MKKKSISQAEQMCDGLSDELKARAIPLAESLLALQDKLAQQTPIYATQPLAQEVTVGTGETILRSNPITQEYRATVRDYSQALKAFNDLIASEHEKQPRIDKNVKLHVVGNSKWKRA